MEPFYFKPENEEQVKEMLERVIANGANDCENLKYYGWNSHTYWGVDVEHDTYTSEHPRLFEHTQLTFEQIQQMFPLPSDKKSEKYKPAQVDSWIKNNLQLKEFWEDVVEMETWHGLSKTKEEVVALVKYYEGRYDMACEFKKMMEE